MTKIYATCESLQDLTGKESGLNRQRATGLHSQLVCLYRHPEIGPTWLYRQPRSYPKSTRHLV